MRVNGLMIVEMDMEDKNGQMAPDMKAIGKMIKLMDLVDFITLMEIYTKENG